MPGSAGIAVVGLRAEGGEATLTTNAFCSVAVGVVTAAAKTRCVESGSQAGRPIWPLVIVEVAAAPVRLRTRRLGVLRAGRREAVRLPAGSHDTELKGAEAS